MSNSKKVDMKVQKVRLRIDGKQVIGKINITGFDRLSDFLNKTEDRFITLFDVETESFSPVTCINVLDIKMVTPTPETETKSPKNVSMSDLING